MHYDGRPQLAIPTTRLPARVDQLRARTRPGPCAAVVRGPEPTKPPLPSLLCIGATECTERISGILSAPRAGKIVKQNMRSVPANANCTVLTNSKKVVPSEDALGCPDLGWHRQRGGNEGRGRYLALIRANSAQNSTPQGRGVSPIGAN